MKKKIKLTPSQLADKDLITTHKGPKPAQSPKYLDEVFWMDDGSLYYGTVLKYDWMNDQYCIVKGESFYRRAPYVLFESMHEAIDNEIHKHLQAIHEVLQAIEDGDIVGEKMVQEHFNLVERYKKAIRFLESMERTNGKTFKK